MLYILIWVPRLPGIDAPRYYPRPILTYTIYKYSSTYIDIIITLHRMHNDVAKFRILAAVSNTLNTFDKLLEVSQRLQTPWWYVSTNKIPS